MSLQLTNMTSNNANMASVNTILSQPLWCNINVFQCNSILYTNWSRSGLLYVSDCITKDGNIFTEQQCTAQLYKTSNWIAEYIFVRRHLKNIN